MTDLIKALTRLANAGAEYLEKQSSPLLPLGVDPTKTASEAIRALPDAPAPTPAENKKARKPKAQADAPAPAAPAPAPLAEMTEEQSAKQVYDYAKALIQRYPKPVEDGTKDKDGQPFPEGYHMARKLLAGDFKVGKIADLVHAQRVQFIVKVRELVAKADSAATPAPVAGDVGIGV